MSNLSNKERFSSQFTWCYTLAMFVVIPFLSVSQINNSGIFSDSVLYEGCRIVEMSYDGDTIFLDSSLIDPIRFQIRYKGRTLPDKSYKLIKNRLFINKGVGVGDSIQVDYCILPIPIHPVQNKSFTLIEPTANYDIIIGQPYTYNPFNKNGEAISFSDLQYAGVFSRGVSLGNNQDLILNSNFNLQLSGKIGEIDVLGSLSDNNIPLQPDGNTQQLQDFDRIFIEFSYKRNKLKAGDFDLRSPRNMYFSKYFRRLQGGHIFTNFKINKTTSAKTDASFAVSRGTFYRNSFIGEEGNQGPYRLQGENGELFLIIIAGSERVYIDGQLMKRGADNDYIIDYNLGEITFTTRQIITKDKRIQVEFSYTNFNYLRTIATAHTEWNIGKRVTVRFDLYSEQDDKGQSVTESLSDSARQTLISVGDDVESAYISSLTPIQNEEGNSGIFYDLTDTTIGTFFYDSILVYQAFPDSSSYRVSFTAFPDGGDYIRDASSTNGVIYQWVGRDTITQEYLGTHRPVRLLTAPQRKQMYSLGVDVDLEKGGIVTWDGSISHQDLNTFSTIGNNDNVGLATRLAYKNRIFLSRNTSRDTSLQLGVGVTYEFIGQQFKTIEPFRFREFNRDWNIQQAIDADQQFYMAHLDLNSGKWGSIRYQLEGLQFFGAYTALKQGLLTRVNYQGISIQSKTTIMQSQTNLDESLFIRPKWDISFSSPKFKALRVGLLYEQEYNRQISMMDQQLSPLAFHFIFMKAYADFDLSEKTKIKADYIRRYDWNPDSTDFALFSTANDVNFGGNFQPNKTSNLVWNFTIRQLDIQDTIQTTLRDKQTYLGRLEYNAQTKKGFIRSNTVYELGSGQQREYVFSFVQVDQGRGTHQWIDRNEDGEQQINEFELSNFQDQADFIRVSLITGDFIRTDNLIFSQSLHIQPARLIRNPTNTLQTLLKKTLIRSIFRVERKSLEQSTLNHRFNPFDLSLLDSLVVSSNYSFRNVLYFNRTGVYSVEFTHLQSANKRLLATGAESRNLMELLLRQRINVRPKRGGTPKNLVLTKLSIQASIEAKYTQQQNEAELFLDRRYQLRNYMIKPVISALYDKNIRIEGSYSYINKKNQWDDQETFLAHDVSINATYNRSSKTNIRVGLTYVNVQFSGDLNTPVAYAMTEGLNDGNNYLWNVSINQALSKNIQLIFSYEGRLTGDNPIVHVGRAQIRANF